MLRSARRVTISIGLTAFICFSHLIKLTPAAASHSFLVTPVQACLDGAMFSGEPIADSSVGVLLYGQVLDNTATFVAAGDTHIFDFVGEIYTFTVFYDEGTFDEGDDIYLSASDELESEFGVEGDSEVTTVESCFIGGGNVPSLSSPFCRNLVSPLFLQALGC